MAIVRASVDVERDLTLFKVEGELTVDDIIQTIQEHYSSMQTKLALWDATEGTGSSITGDELRRLSHVMRDFAPCRMGGKTAMVSASDLDYGLGRMYESLAELEELPWEYRTFRSLNEARDWLGLDN